MAKPTNPNGANQYLLDPRQKLCWDLYVNPKSATFGDAKNSALKAGYEETTADQITVAEWFLGKTRRMNLLGKAEKVLEQMLDMPVEIIEYDKNGEEDEEPQSYLTTDPALVKIKQDTAKFVAERQGKDVGYSTRSEITGANGQNLVPEAADEEAAAKAVADYMKKHGQRKTSHNSSNTSE